MHASENVSNIALGFIGSAGVQRRLRGSADSCFAAGPSEAATSALRRHPPKGCGPVRAGRFRPPPSLPDCNGVGFFRVHQLQWALQTSEIERAWPIHNDKVFIDHYQPLRLHVFAESCGNGPSPGLDGSDESSLGGIDRRSCTAIALRAKNQHASYSDRAGTSRFVRAFDRNSVRFANRSTSLMILGTLCCPPS